MFALLAAAVSLPSSAAHAQTPANWTEPYPPFHVIGNVYYVGSAGLSAWLIRTHEGLILLDVGVPANAEMVETNIKALGFRVKDVKILLNSHAHFDHSGGLAKLKADSGAKLYASAGDRYALEKGVYPGWENRATLNFPPVAVDRVLKDGDTVRLGGVSLTAVLTPGHSAGCTSYLMKLRDRGKPHTAFFFCSASVAANRLAPDPQYPGIIDDYRKTFARLKTIHADVYLAPHAEFFDLVGKRAAMTPGKPNPFVKPGELESAVAKFDSDFEAALAKQEAGAVSPKPADTAPASPTPPETRP
jgi:metallo-beta-lactamase class B